MIQVVEEESATLKGYRKFAIDHDHIDMCKFREKQDTGYTRILSILLEVLAGLNSKEGESKTVGIMLYFCLWNCCWVFVGESKDVATSGSPLTMSRGPGSKGRLKERTLAALQAELTWARQARRDLRSV